MKIKCPYCKSEINADNNDKARWWLREHLRNHDLQNLRITLADLTFKIHEKIASIEKLEKESKDYRNPPPPICNSKVKQELKSLLE